MRKIATWIVSAVFMIGIMLTALSINVQMAEAHYCVLMKFVNNTRFKNLAPETKLSDLVMEKLVASGKFHLKETRPIDEKIGVELYDADLRASKVISKAENGNFDALFDDRRAASMSEAHQGQVISPELTSRIGKAHGAEYLIQGTILNVGRGTVQDNDTSVVTGFTGILVGKIGSTAGDVLRNTNKTYTGVNIQTELRVIKADTGDVVWSKMVTSASKQEKLKVGDIISAGSDQMSMNLYELALDQAAKKIVDELISDLDKGLVPGL